MRNALRKMALLFAALIIVGCAGSVTNWEQFHGDLSSQGLQRVDSGFALSSAWVSESYKITSSSPVIGKDFEGREIIYVGTIDARLVAINSEDGSQKWSRTLSTGESASQIVASPAVSEKGDIFVITNHQIEDGGAHSTLFKLDKFGNPRWSYSFPDNGFTSGSPKVLTAGEQTLIFVYLSVGMIDDIQGELFVLRDGQTRAELLDRKQLGRCRYDATGAGRNVNDIFARFEDIWHFITDFPVELGESGIVLPDTFVDPTPAVASDRPKPLIAVADNLCSVGAYEWHGGQLSILWHEDHDFEQHSSTVLLPNGLMVFGRKDGKVLAYDADTGVKMWEYDAGEAVFATPSAPSAKVIFVVSKNHIQVVQTADGTLVYDGVLPRKLELFGQTYASPAVTANRVYVSTAEMLTATHDLKTRGHDTNFRGNGLSSLAVSIRGDVYGVGIDGTIRKYSGTE